jgi:uncharacterized protein (TIGR03437 family)
MKRAILPFLLAVAFCEAVIQTPGNVAYVVDNGTGQVWVVDLGTRLMDVALPCGAGASELLVLPSNRLGFVTNYDAGTVCVLDLRNNTVQPPIPLNQGPGPSSLAATPDGLRACVANLVNSTVSVIDTPTLTVLATFEVGRTPVQVETEPRGRFAYTVNQGAGTLSVIDISRKKVVKSLTVGTQPSQFVILPNRNTAYVVNKGSNNLTLVDLTTNEVVGNPVPVGSTPASAAYSSDSSKLYVVNSGSSNISVVSTATNQQTALIPTGVRPVAMALKSGSSVGYVANQGSNTVTAVNLTDNTAYKQIPVGNQPSSVVLDPNQDFLFVTNTGSGTVSVINVNTDSLTSTMAGPGGRSSPVQFALLNPPRLLEIAPNPAPNGGTIFLTGEGFMQSSRVRITPPTGLPFTLAPAALDNQVLQMDLPSYSDAQVVVEVINADRSSSERITLRSGVATPLVNPGGVVEAAGFARAPSPISGNALVAIFGNFPGMARADAPAYQFPLPRSLGNAKVTFNGVPAPLLATIPLQDYHQINAVAPLHLVAQDDVRVAVTIGVETSPAELIFVAPTSPGIFVVSQDGAAAAVHANGSLVTLSNAAARNETVSLYVTGLGSADPLPVEGEAAPTDVLARTLLPVRVIVAGVESPKVDFSGLAPGFAGLYQINFQVPPLAPIIGLVDVKVLAGSRESNTAKLAVR